MRVEIKIDDTATEPRAIIVTDRITEEINEMVRSLSRTAPQPILGMRKETVRILEPESILRIYGANGKVFAATEEGEYQLRLRLYELEERLRRDSFVRISNSEIINLKKALHFDLNLAGTICVSFADHSVSYVSRRYVSKIKEVLGL
ncbi:MAG: LytTR family transcriptional regulator [Firmicutes bacterium]|nr:LytTR family transcriptional regulator [Bacillota bacterium]